MKAIYKDNKKLIEDPSEQASSFAYYLKKNLGKILSLKTKGVHNKYIGLTNVNEAITIGVTLS